MLLAIFNFFYITQLCAYREYTAVRLCILDDSVSIQWQRLIHGTNSMASSES